MRKKRCRISPTEATDKIKPSPTSPGFFSSPSSISVLVVASDCYTVLLSETYLFMRGSINCLQRFPLLPSMIIGKSLLPVIVLGGCRSLSVPSFLVSPFLLLRTWHCSRSLHAETSLTLPRQHETTSVLLASFNFMQ